MAQGGVAQLLEPRVVGNRVGIERGDPGRLAVRRAEIAGGGEAEIGVSSRSPNPIVRWTLGKKLERLARRADFVIVANKFLQSWAEDAGAASVTCIPTVVDLRRYPQTALPPAEPFTIGWIGTPETAPYLEDRKSV